MNKIILYICIFSFLLAESNNMQFLSFLEYDISCSDITGFAQDDREFAVIGLLDAASFVDITDPLNPFEIDRIEGSNSIWRDLKYWNRHVYIGTEADDGIKIVSVDNPDQPVLVNTIIDIDNSHNIHIDADGYLYIVGADEHDVWIYSLDDPVNPNLIGTWSTEYCHDIEVYNNKLYCAAIYTGHFYIVDVADKSNPQTLVTHFTGSDGISTHDVAVTEDEQYLFTGDENLGGHIKVWDISDYDNINLVDEYQTPDGSNHTSHNLYVRAGTDYLIISYYADGTRIVDISDPTNIEEIAYYDMSEAEGLYVSNWGTYADLPSGNIISSDIEQGLFVLALGGVNISHDDIQDIDIDMHGPDINFVANIDSFEGDITNVQLHYSYDNINWDIREMNNVDNDLYETVLTPDQEGIIVYYYITASNSLGLTSRYPQIEGENILFVYGDLEDISIQDFENESNWYVESDANDGEWVLEVPIGTYTNVGFYGDTTLVQTDDDHTENGSKCYITGNNADPENPGQDDVDGGSTILYSNIYNLANFNDIFLTYWRWYTNNLGANPGSDQWLVEVSSDGGVSWVDLERTHISLNSWSEKRFVLSEFIELTDQVQFRFIAEDIFNEGDGGSGGSLIEAAVDDFKLEAISFESIEGDLNFDHFLNILDVVLLINFILGEIMPTDTQFLASDLNFDGSLNVIDVVTLVNLVLLGP